MTSTTSRRSIIQRVANIIAIMVLLGVAAQCYLRSSGSDRDAVEQPEISVLSTVKTPRQIKKAGRALGKSKGKGYWYDSWYPSVSTYHSALFVDR